MKVLYVAPGLGICGGIRVIWQHCLELSKRGHQAVLAVPNAQGGWLPGRVEVKVYEECLDEDWDVVVATGWQTWDASGQFKAISRWGFVQMAEALFYRDLETQGLAHRALASRGFRVFTISKWLKWYLEDWCGQEGVEIVPNGVDTSIFYPDPVRGMKADRPVALVVGHELNPCKNVSDAARAIRMAGDFELWHVYAFDPGVSIGADREWEAPPQDMLRMIYSTADVLVMSSRVEGRSCLPVEAMACQCPVVLMNHRGLDDVCGGRALIADPRDVGHLTKIIQFCMDDRRETASRVDASYNYVLGNLRWSDIGKRLEGLYA